jgi:ATP-dependent phosphoenolpyruvate carboxykinase
MAVAINDCDFPLQACHVGVSVFICGPEHFWSAGHQFNSFINLLHKPFYSNIPKFKMQIAYN